VGIRTPDPQSAFDKLLIWMVTQAEMISGRHSGFLLGPSWSDLGKVLMLAVSLETILMKWDTCRDPDEDQNLTTTTSMKKKERKTSFFCKVVQDIFVPCWS